MRKRVNITQVANFDNHDESNLAQRWKKWKQSFEFYLAPSGTDNDLQIQALLLHCAGPDGQGNFMHLSDVGTTCKAAMDANHFEPTKNVKFERLVFSQAIQGMNVSSINVITRLRKRVCTCEFAKSDIRDQFIGKWSSKFSCHCLQEELDLTLQNVIKKIQAMELAEK